MTLGHERRGRIDGASQRERLRPALIVAVATFIAFVTLVAADALAPVYAIIAAVFIVVTAFAVANLVRHESGVETPAEEAYANPRHVTSDIIATAIQSIPNPVIVLDGDAVVIAFNEPAAAAAPTLRKGEHSLIGLRMPVVVEAVRRALASGESQYVEFSERVPVDRWYAAYISPTAQLPGFPQRLFFLTLDDLTPMRRVEEMRADFVANASHELRTPLAALSGFIDTLQGSARDDPRARERFLDIMKQQAWRMARLIDDLLSLSRIELNAHIQPDSAVELAPVLRQVVDGLQMLAHQRQVEVSISVDESLTVTGDRDELIRVFENLVENGLKYGGAGKRVEVTLQRSGSDEAKVTVRDYGPGIAPEHLPRLTERFYRVDVGHSRAEGGTGLGLALVKHILNRHRGRLQIDSAPGEGARFTVYLPTIPSR